MKKIIEYIFPNKNYYLTTFTISVLILLLSIKLFSISISFIPLVFILILLVVISVNVILKNPNLGILITFAIMPFEYIGGFYYHSIHIRFDQIIIGITGIIYIISSLIKKDFKIKKDPTFIIIGALIIANILSLTNALNFSRSIDIFLFTLITYLIYYAIPVNFFDIKYVKYIPYIIASITILLSIFGIYQYIGNLLNLPGSVLGLRAPYLKNVLGYPRIEATEVEPLYYGTYLIFSITLSLGILIFNKGKNILKKNLKNLLYISSILGIINLIFTYARGAWIGEGISLLILGIIYLVEYKIPKKMIYTGIVFIIFVIAIGGVLYKINKLPHFATSIINRATNLSSPDRVYLDSNALQAFENNVLFGIGVGGFGPYMSINPYIIPSRSFGQIEGYGWAIVNNEYLEILSETGIVGFILFVMLFIKIIQNFIKAVRVNKYKNSFERVILISTFAAMIGILVQYTTFSTLYILQIWMVIMLVEVISINILHDR